MHKPWVNTRKPRTPARYHRHRRRALKVPFISFYSRGLPTWVHAPSAKSFSIHLCLVRYFHDGAELASVRLVRPPVRYRASQSGDKSCSASSMPPLCEPLCLSWPMLAPLAAALAAAAASSRCMKKASLAPAPEENSTQCSV